MLERMENILLGFQSDLGGISNEIKHLQSESMLMSVKIKNRRAVEDELKKLLQNMVVSDALIVGICQEKVSERYLEYLRQLDEKIKFTRDQNPFNESLNIPPPCETAAAQDIEPQLERLRLKAVAKVRAFLLEQFSTLRKPKTNLNMVQQNILLKFTRAVEFLQNHAPAVYSEVKNAYAETLSQVHTIVFRSYYSNMLRVKTPGVAVADVIAAGDVFVRESYDGYAEYAGVRTKPSGATSFLGLGQDSKPKYTSMYSPPIRKGGKGGKTDNFISQRQAMLGLPDSKPLVVRDSTNYYFECIFRSVQKHLMDSATSEYLFTIDFFPQATNTQNREIFNQIFAKTLSLCLENLENYLYNCYDVVALLLMIKVTQSHQLIMERRRVPCLDGYFDHINMMLWPRFKRVYEHNLKSMENAINSTNTLGPIDIVQPHYISRRYAEFTSAVQLLSSQLQSKDEMLGRNSIALREQFVALLKALASQGEKFRVLTTEKSKLIFFINNFDSVLSTFSEVKLPKESPDIEYFESLLATDTELYIEAELLDCYGRIINFVKLQEGDDSQNPAFDEVQALVNDFNVNWKSGLELLNSAVQTYFQEDTSVSVLKQMLTQLLLYYTRFLDVAKKFGYDKKVTGLVSISAIMEEIKTKT